MRHVIISILITGQPPRLNYILPPRSTTTIQPQDLPPTPSIADTTIQIPNHKQTLIPITSLVSSPMSPTLTKLTTWNIDKQATYDGTIKACLHGDIDILHCTEPAKHMTLGTRATFTLINAADKAGYTLYVTDHSHIYIRQASIHTRLISQRSVYNGRLHTFLFQGDD